jgi:hypothetical protein
VAITRAEAGRIAREYLAAPPGWAGWPIGKVVDLEEITTVRSPRDPLGISVSCDLTDCWIVYLEPAATLRSNTILVISKSDGRIVFFGSAGDDG